MPTRTRTFDAVLEIIGINPFVFVPPDILSWIFSVSGKSSGPIPVRGTINGNQYTQTLVKFRGDWRLYVNTVMLPGSPRRIGDTLHFTIQFDDRDRNIAPHPRLTEALRRNHQALEIFESLAPSLRKEIIRYISSLKSESSVMKNVERAIGFLLGKNRFIGRDKP